MKVSIFSKDEMAISSKGRGTSVEAENFNIQAKRGLLLVEADMPAWSGKKAESEAGS